MLQRTDWAKLNWVQWICAIVALLCVVNWIWCLLGKWSITSNGKTFQCNICGSLEPAARKSEISSCRGYLFIGVYDAYVGGDWRTSRAPPPPIGVALPPSIHVSIGDGGDDVFIGRHRVGIFAIGPGGRDWYMRGIDIHWLLLTLIFSLWPAFTLYRTRRRRRFASDRCQRCGYDLRATPDCCPECGTPAKLPMVASP
jgi:hypothetical protein